MTNFKLTVAFALLLLSACTSNVEKKTTERIEAYVETLRLQMINPDSAKLAAITSDQLSYGHSSGKIEDKASFLRTLITGQSDFVEIELSDQTIVGYNETAIVRHTLKGKRMDNGVPGEVNLKSMLDFRREFGEWKLFARQAVKNS